MQGEREPTGDDASERGTDAERDTVRGDGRSGHEHAGQGRSEDDRTGVEEPRWMSLSEEVVRANTTRGAGAGIQFGAVIVLFTLAGVWADRRFGTLPLFLLLGLALGFGGGLYHLMRTLGRRSDGA